MATQNIIISIYRDPISIPTPSGSQISTLGGWARTDGGFIDFNPDGTYNQNGLISGETNDSNKHAINRMLRFMADDYLLLAGYVYRWNTGIDAWEISLDLNALGAVSGSSRNIGLYAMHINDDPYMVTAWQSGSTDTWASARYNGRTQVWETGNLGSVFTTSDTQGSVHTEIQHRNKIYFVGSSNVNMAAYDAATDTFSVIPFGENIRHPIDFCVYNDVLYALTKNVLKEIVIHRVEATTTRALRLGEASGTESPTELDNFEGRNLLFVDNSFDATPKMYAFALADTSTSGSWAMFEILDSGGGLVETARLDSKIPFDTNRGEEQIYRCFADHRNRWTNDSTGDGSTLLNTSHYNISFRENGDIHSIYSRAFWNGGEQISMPGNTFGIQSHWASAHTKVGDGSRVSERLRLTTDDARLMDIVLNRAVPIENGRMRLHFNVLEASGYLNGTPCGVRWFYDENGHTPQKQCTISNPSDGTISGVHNLMAGIEIQDAEFTVDWHAQDDGIDRFQFVNLLGHVVTTGVV